MVFLLFAVPKVKGLPFLTGIAMALVFHERSHDLSAYDGGMVGQSAVA